MNEERELPLFDQPETIPASPLTAIQEVRSPALPFGKYIVYVDESGEHGMERIDDLYPVFEIIFSDKKAMSSGLQLADLVARPIGLHVFRPTQRNQAFEVLEKKFYCAGGRDRVGFDYEQWGLKIHPPRKSERPR